MRWGKQVSNKGMKCQVIAEEKKVLMCVFVHVMRVRENCGESNKYEAPLDPVSNHTSQENGAPHFKISRPVILTLIFCLFCLTRSTPSTQR